MSVKYVIANSIIKKAVEKCSTPANALEWFIITIVQNMNAGYKHERIVLKHTLKIDLNPFLFVDASTINVATK